eukprot:gnl/MRDRNA2_/MRDRNA2_57685_c0_seq1.p1 gnl/MRDRNA2_/MRDRNA2_57685_c0~~gnl/MRDRNA2_/MRDRNA2_57685_c0_seq1.p1  ORF type:complete len:110 (+),score=25.95 gnl/MRDRNA2_/MRDRNA2_57685_c0_seq1:95-424(+)
MQIVAPARFLDGVVFSVFLLFISGFGLYMFSSFHKFVLDEKSKLGFFSDLMDKMFPFPNHKFAFNLTHVLLFAVLIALLSMVHHPAQELIQQDIDNKKEKAAKKKKEED